MNDVSLTIAGTAETRSRESLREANGSAGHRYGAPARHHWPWVIAGLIVAGFVAAVLMELYFPNGEAWTDDAYAPSWRTRAFT